MWPWVIYLTPKWPLRRKSLTNHKWTSQFVRKPLKILKSLQETGIRKSERPFQRYHNEPPNFSSTPQLRTRTKRKNIWFSTFKWYNSATKLFKNFERQSSSYKCLEGNSKKFFEIDVYLTIIHRFHAPLAMALCSKRCISETAASICLFDTPLEIL